MKFSELGLDRVLLNALDGLGHDKPTPIQSKAIPTILAGKDVIGLAQTGTGKTAAFSLPLLQRLAALKGRPQPKTCRALILAPTRELVTQIIKSIKSYSQHMKLSSMAIFGGVSIRPQIATMARGVDIVVATPGRLLDLLDQKAMRLDKVEVLILDEADQMLDIGFMPAIRRVVSMVPDKRQTLLFSATMPKEIRKLTSEHLTDPEEIAVAPISTPADRIRQSVLHVSKQSKTYVVSHLLRENEGKRVIVFTRTKHGADRVVRQLAKDGFTAAAIHGNKSQNNREKALNAFRAGDCPVLVATDIAARGIDVPGIELVINYDLPDVPEVYIHRIGRTARAGASGFAVAFCSPDERLQLRGIERLLKKQIDLMPVPDGIEDVSDAPAEKAPPRKRHSRRRSGGPKPKPRNPDSQKKRPNKKKKPSATNAASQNKKRRHRGPKKPGNKGAKNKAA